MSRVQLPKSFLQFSMGIATLVATSWWVNYELSTVSSAAGMFLPIFLLMLTARVVLGLVFCGASIGIGMGSYALSMVCFRYLNQKSSNRRSVRYLRTCFSTIVAVIVFVVTYGVGINCIGATNLFADSVMLIGLQVVELWLLRFIVRMRGAKETVPQR